MSKIIKYGIIALLFTITVPAFACVSIGASHTCNKDCEGYNGVWYLLCIYGGQRHEPLAKRGIYNLRMPFSIQATPSLY